MKNNLRLMHLIVLWIGLLQLLACSTQKSDINSMDNYFVFLNTNPDREKLDSAAVAELQKGHMANIQRLGQEKKLIVAGPFHTGGGIFIFRAPNLETVNKWLSTDPAIRAGRFRLEKYRLITQAGQICEADSDYTMVTYQFIHLKPVHFGLEPLEEQSYQDFLVEIDSDSLLIFAGQFEHEDHDGFLITNFNNLDAAKQRLAALSLVQTGDVTMEAKELWIAKESFCQEH